MASVTNSRCRAALAALHVVAAVIVLLAACGEQDPVARRVLPLDGQRKKPPVTPERRAVEDLRSPSSQLYLQYHRRWVVGDVLSAAKGLEVLVRRQDAPSAVRAQAAFWAAEIAELRGQRRRALAYLDRVKQLSDPGTELAKEAEDRRARILTNTPLADVRGPVPGSVRLRDTPPVLAAFRIAELRLVRYHRVVVAPQLENIDQVRRGKRRALERAVAAYERVVKKGGDVAKAAALFRIAAMYHHMAEALAFKRPPEMLKREADKLKRQLRGESIAYLRRALANYRTVVRMPPKPGVGLWRSLARREAETLARVVEARRKRGR